MATLGIDPGSLKCGWAIVERDQLVAHGLIKMKSTDPIETRCSLLAVNFEKIINQHLLMGFHISVAMETPILGKHQNVKSLVVLAQARGAIAGAVGGYHVRTYLPQDWKQYCGGLTASKSEIQEYVRRYFYLPDKLSADESDAAAIAIVNENYKEWLSRVTTENTI